MIAFTDNAKRVDSTLYQSFEKTVAGGVVAGIKGRKNRRTKAREATCY